MGFTDIGSGLVTRKGKENIGPISVHRLERDYTVASNEEPLLIGAAFLLGIGGNFLRATGCLRRPQYERMDIVCGSPAALFPVALAEYSILPIYSTKSFF